MFQGYKTDDTSTYSEYDWNKINFINDVFVNNPLKSQQTKWTHFKSYIRPVEKKMNRDFSTLDEKDIDDLLVGIESKNKNIIGTVFKLLSSYIDWTMEKENRIKINPMKNMSKTKYMNLNKKNAIKRYSSIDDIFNLCEEAGNFGMSAQDIIIILLCRYGINGEGYEYLKYLKWENIDFQNKIIKIIDNRTKKEKWCVSFDNRLAEWLMKSKECTKNARTKYYDKGYVVKVTKESDDVINKDTIFTRTNRIFKDLGKEKISLGNLTKFKMIDDLKEIRIGKQLSSDDFKSVFFRYTNVSSKMAYQPLKEYYSEVMEDNNFIRLGYKRSKNNNDEFPEGKQTSELHLKRERNRKVINIAKSRFKKKYGRLFCEVCGFDFSEKYGELGEDFIEGHHKKPISQLKEGDTTTPEDIIMLCSNCHSMIHMSDENLSVEDLKAIINNKDRNII